MSPSLRRALCRVVAGATAAAMFSIHCSKQNVPTGVSGGGGTLASIVIAPVSDTLSASGTRQFTAIGRDAAGNPVAITPTWSVASGEGTITPAGMFTAAASPGTATVRAMSGSVSGSATIVVQAATPPPPGPLATIAVAPNPASVAVTGTQQFAAAGKDAQGNTVAFTPTWSLTSGSGTITSSGLFTAGSAPGTATVKATSGSVSGTATVTVTSGSVATIVVSPDNQTIATAGTLQFSAKGKDAAGNTVTVAPVWSIASGGGTITSSGLFTAGSSPGASVVRATSGSISGSATVTVVSSSGMGSWTERAPMPTPRAYFATGVVNGLLYAVGGVVGVGPAGNQNEAYDPTSNTWSTKASMPTPRLGAGGAVVNNILYVVGGHHGDATGVTAVLEAYDPATNTWTTKAPMPTPRSDFVAGVVNGILYVVGGYNNQYLTTVEAYDPVTNTWTTKAPLPAPRFGGAAVVNGILYVVSGLDAQNNAGTVDAYDPATNTWTARAAAAMPTPRSRFCVGVLNGLVYALGGDAGGNGGARNAEAYDPATNRWTAKADMQYGRESCGAESVAGRLFVVGGTVQGHFIEPTEAFQP